MKKQLLALAVSSLVALPAVSVADTGPILYGKVNVSLENTDTDDGVISDDEWELRSNASRIGVVGSLDLDYTGLEAIYKAEFQVAVDDGDNGDGNTFKQRNIYGGFTHDQLGTLIAGNFDTPLKDAQGDVDQFDNLQADIKSIMGGENRLSDLIMYSTPQIADMVSVNVAIRPGEDAENDNGGIADGVSSSVVFETDILYAALAYDQDIPTQLVDAGFSKVNEADVIRAVAGAGFANFELGVLFQQAEDNASGSNFEDQSMLVSGAFYIDRLKLKAQYGITEGDLTDNEGTLMAFGADYKLDDKSKGFMYIAQIEEEILGAATQEDTIYGVGFEHKFSM